MLPPGAYAPGGMAFRFILHRSGNIAARHEGANTCSFYINRSPPFA